MRYCIRAVLLLSTVAAVSAASFADPASARRRVIDASSTFTLVDYCSPLEASSGCSSQPLPFAIQLGGQTYNSYYLNSNGTMSLGSIETHLAAQNSFAGESLGSPVYTGPSPATNLASLGAPVFSPAFLDGPGYFVREFTDTPGFDGELVGTRSITSGSLTLQWFACTSPLNCGSRTLDAISSYAFNPSPLNDLQNLIMSFSTVPCPCAPEDVFLSGQQNFLNQLNSSLNIYTLTLSPFEDGFVVDYTYNPASIGDIGTYGFNLPTASFEATGPLTNRRFAFDRDGRLVAPVPEPGSWALLLLGFGFIGASMRRSRRVRVSSPTLMKS